MFHEKYSFNHLCLILPFQIIATLILISGRPAAFAENYGEHSFRLLHAVGAYSQPAVSELDSNHANGPEVVIAGGNGTVAAYRLDGSVVWSRDLPNRTCQAPNNDKLYSSPVVANLFGDSRKFIIVGYGGFRVKECDGGVVALNANDGTIFWIFSIKKFAKKKKFFAFRHAVFAKPAVADVDGDGKMEIGFGSFDRNIYLLGANGKPRWYYNAADTVWSSPTFADINGDGKLELIIGSDISQNLRMKPPTHNGGYLYALKTDNLRGKLVPFRSPRLVIWQKAFEQVIHSAPVIAELIPNNPGSEIVIGSGCFFPQNTNNKIGKWYKVVNLKNGETLATLPIDACTPSAAAIADINGDGLNEIIGFSNGSKKLGGSGRSYIFAWDPRAAAELWRINVDDFTSGDPFLGHFKGPALFANSCSQNLLLASPIHNWLALSDPTTDEILETYRTQSGRISSTPTIADLNGDDNPDVIYAAGNRLYYLLESCDTPPPIATPTPTPMPPIPTPIMTPIVTAIIN
ncbi:MAG TPA: FG-GAP-like repeat-containing protein [Oligoflexia bacterium]|nr:FG-GAP-like repeat-containing protein [Oligoflexia bacterium]HMP27187.1 FG-GAP-like repeat-containing protein [Oligoflexia bacterium]